MFDRFLKKASELLAADEPFVVATVVRYEAPISGKPGDKAIIRANGKMWGWIGGGCSQPVVITEALKALADGRPRLVRISPTAIPGEKGGTVDYTMTCHSGGSLDIYIEPVLAKPHIVIIGRSPVAQTLTCLGKAINYQISVVAEADRELFADADRLVTSLNEINVTQQCYLVVSTQGEDDEEAVEAALSSNAVYVAFVASKVKAQKVMEYLKEKGMADESLTRMKAPAGLDIQAASPEEIAVSILAEIILARGSKAQASADTTTAKRSMPLPVITAQAKDPICNMMVDTTKAKYVSEYRGRKIYFCCAGCKQTFDRQPEQYVV
jgi:xanthine dehydrogenase accessory factor